MSAQAILDAYASMKGAPLASGPSTVEIGGFTLKRLLRALRIPKAQGTQLTHAPRQATVHALAHGGIARVDRAARYKACTAPGWSTRDHDNPRSIRASRRDAHLPGVTLA